MTTIITLSNINNNNNIETICFVMEQGASTMIERRIGAKLVARSHYSVEEGIEVMNMYLKDGYRMEARRSL